MTEMTSHVSIPADKIAGILNSPLHTPSLSSASLSLHLKYFTQVLFEQLQFCAKSLIAL